jgi:hypothetical protein
LTGCRTLLQHVQSSLDEFFAALFLLERVRDSNIILPVLIGISSFFPVIGQKQEAFSVLSSEATGGYAD